MRIVRILKWEQIPDLKKLLAWRCVHRLLKTATRIIPKKEPKSFMNVDYYCPTGYVLIHHLADHPGAPLLLLSKNDGRWTQWRKGERLPNKILSRVFKSAPPSLQAVTSLLPLTGIQIHLTLIGCNRILIQNYAVKRLVLFKEEYTWQDKGLLYGS